MQGAGCFIRNKSSRQSSRKFLVIFSIVCNATSPESLKQLLGEFFEVTASQVGIAGSDLRQDRHDATVQTRDDWDVFTASLQDIHRALVAFLGALPSIFSFAVYLFF